MIADRGALESIEGALKNGGDAGKVWRAFGLQLRLGEISDAVRLFHSHDQDTPEPLKMLLARVSSNGNRDFLPNLATPPVGVGQKGKLRFSTPNSLEWDKKPPSWLWAAFLGPGIVTDLSAKPKVGKSTFLVHLVSALLEGRPFLGFETRKQGAILTSAHERKHPGSPGDARRGSGAFLGGVDVGISMRRPNDNAGGPAVRELHSLSRFDLTPERLTVELTDQGYVAHASGADAARRVAVGKIKTVTPDSEGDALTSRELFQAAGVARATGQRVLTDLWEEGQISRIGIGKKSDPYRYFSGDNYDG